MKKITMAALACAALQVCAYGCGGGGSDESPESAPAIGCAARTVTVALLGDSTQAGRDGSTAPNYTQAPHNPGVQLQADMDDKFGPGAVIVNDLSVGGTGATQSPHPQADVVVANFGINDSARGESIEVYKAAMLATGATLIETQNPVLGEQERDAAYVNAARGLGLPVADVNAYLNDKPAAQWWSHLGDGIHPDDALYVEIVDNVLAPAVAKQVAVILRCAS